MKQVRRLGSMHKWLYKEVLTLILTGGCALTPFAVSYADDIGTEVWQQQYNATTYRNFGIFNSAGFNHDGSVLAGGYRGEADSGSAVGVRYNAETGAGLDSPPEWILVEKTWSDYAQDSFFDQHVDSSGNIYFVGRSYAAGYNLFRPRYTVPNIWKFKSDYASPAGSYEWRSYYAPSLPAEREIHSMGEYSDMAVDSSDSIYAVGWYDNTPFSAADRDWIIDKYDSDGNRATGFPKIIDRDGLHDYANAVVADSEGNFVVVGSELVIATDDHHDWVVRKYQGDGTLLWETSYDFNGGHDAAFSVIVAADDNIIVGGYRRNLPADENDWYFVKYAKDGNGSGGATVLWEQFWDDGNAKHGTVYAMLLDDLNNFYAIGGQLKDSTVPAYSDRNRPVLQYRSGSTGELLKIQDIVLDASANNEPAKEHDYLRRIAISGDLLVLGGYTRHDEVWSNSSLDNAYTGRVVMLKLVPPLDDASFYLVPSPQGGAAVFGL